MDSSLRLTFVTKADPDCGNFNTAKRICQGLVSIRPSWTYKIVSTTSANALEDLANADVLICLHLYRCACLLDTVVSGSLRLPPIIGIVGGTDLNEDAKHSDRRSVMKIFVQRCRHIVAFSESLRNSLELLMSEDLDHGFKIPSVSIIPQGISVPQLQLEIDHLETSSSQSLFKHSKYFVIVGRIRPVKNCCSVLAPFQQWKQRNSTDQTNRLSQIQLLFIGDIEDSQYGEEFRSKVEALPDVHLMRGVDHSEALRLMQKSVCLINCSISEGQSNSVIEAMSLGVLTIVSAVPGNTDIVKHMETGLVYENNEHLIDCLSLAASEEPSDRTMVRQLKDSAMKFISQSHCIDRELRAYEELIKNCMDHR